MIDPQDLENRFTYRMDDDALEIEMVEAEEDGDTEIWFSTGGCRFQDQQGAK